MGVEQQHVPRGGKISFSEEGGNRYSFLTEIWTPAAKLVFLIPSKKIPVDMDPDPDPQHQNFGRIPVRNY
jgi:hypothetical protein